MLEIDHMQVMLVCTSIDAHEVWERDFGSDGSPVVCNAFQGMQMNLHSSQMPSQLLRIIGF